MGSRGIASTGGIGNETMNKILDGGSLYQYRLEAVRFFKAKYPGSTVRTKGWDFFRTGSRSYQLRIVCGVLSDLESPIHAPGRDEYYTVAL